MQNAEVKMQSDDAWKMKSAKIKVKNKVPRSRLKENTIWASNSVFILRFGLSFLSLHFGF